MEEERMKRWKQAAAICGVIILLAAAVLPMFFAFGSGKNAQGRFRASLGVAIMVPVLAYGMLLVYRLFDKRRDKSGSVYRNIVFDIGNVLLDFGWEAYLDSFSFPPDKARRIAGHVFRSQLWNERDKALYPEEYYVEQIVKELPEYEEDVRLVMENSSSCMHERDYALTWVQYLKNKGYHLYILSNYSERGLKETRDLMTFLPYMDGAVFSCEEKQIKPEPEIYETLLSRYQLDPTCTVFLDDREDNCEAARRKGMKAIRFESLKQAAAELKKLGIE